MSGWCSRNQSAVASLEFLNDFGAVEGCAEVSKEEQEDAKRLTQLAAPSCCDAANVPCVGSQFFRFLMHRCAVDLFTECMDSVLAFMGV